MNYYGIFFESLEGSEAICKISSNIPPSKQVSGVDYVPILSSITEWILQLHSAYGQAQPR